MSAATNNDGDIFSFESLSKKSFDQLVVFWNEGVIRELQSVAPNIDWPVIANPGDLDHPDFRNICTALQEMRKDDYVDGRMRNMTNYLIQELTRESTYLAHLSNLRDTLLDDRCDFVERFQGRIPSPRKLKRHPKVVAGSDVAQQLQLTRFEIYLISDKLDTVIAGIADSIERVGSILAFAKEARAVLEGIFCDRDANDLFELGKFERKARNVQKVTDNAYKALLLRANELTLSR